MNRIKKYIHFLTLGAGLLGAGLHFWENTLGSDGRGLLPAGHPAFVLLYILCALVLGGLFLVLRDVKPAAGADDLPSGPLSIIGYGAGAAGMLATAIVVLLGHNTTISLLAGFLGVFGAGALGLLAYFRFRNKTPHYIFHSAATLGILLFLVFRFQSWNTQPQVNLYFTQLMALVTLMLCFYHRATLDAGEGNRMLFAFFDLAALFFCCTAAVGEFWFFYGGMAVWCFTNLCSLENPKELPPMKLPDEVLYCVETLQDSGSRAYVVGGCVRDHLMGLTPSDYDLCTSATPEQTCEVFARHKLVRSGEKHGTIGVIVADNLYEITTFRTEGDYSDTRHPDWVEFVTDIEKDLARRDFTVNAIAYCPGEGYIDPFNGHTDLDARILRAVGEPEARFREDALRILRGVRFAVRFDLTPEEKTLAAMEKCAPLMSSLAGERKGTELSKLLPQISKQDLLQYKTILLQAVPDLAAMEEEQFSLTAATVAAAEPELTLRMAALLHKLTEEEATSALQALKCSCALRDRTLLLIRLQTMEIPSDKKDLLPLLGEYGEDVIRQLLQLQTAIALAQDKPTDAMEAALQQLNNAVGDGSCLTVKDLAITGSDLLELGMQTGPEIGKCMQTLLSLVQSDVLENTKEALLDAAREYNAAEEETQ